MAGSIVDELMDGDDMVSNPLYNGYESKGQVGKRAGDRA